MRIAIVGKGGSGKSSVSWLLAQYISENHGYVALIDSDHNMDLTSLLKYDFNNDSPSFHRSHDEFRKVVSQKEDKSWNNIILDGRELPRFTIGKHKDSFSKKIFIKISDSIDLAVVGLGGEDILYSTRCAHGHSAPLKYYLPLLKTESNVLIDGVAGVDMINAGVYSAVDVLGIVVEPQPNSIRVCDQIISLAQKTGIPYCVILNKPNNTEYNKQITEKYADVLAGEVPIDIEIITANYFKVNKDTKQNLKTIFEYLQTNFRVTDTLARLKEIETKKRLSRK